MMINYKLIHPNAKFGESHRKTGGSAGYDLYTVEDIAVPMNACVKVRTGVCLDIYDEHNGLMKLYANLLARSSLYGMYGVTIPNGVSAIDTDYQGEIFVPLINTHHCPFDVNIIPAGTAIAQLVFQYYAIPELKQVEEFETKTERGEGGFGSTSQTSQTNQTETIPEHKNNFLEGWCGGYMPGGLIYPLW